MTYASAKAFLTDNVGLLEWTQTRLPCFTAVLTNHDPDRLNLRAHADMQEYSMILITHHMAARAHKASASKLQQRHQHHAA